MATQSLPRQNAISELTQLLGERLTTSNAVRDQHANGECGVYAPQPPDALPRARPRGRRRGRGPIGPMGP